MKITKELDTLELLWVETALMDRLNEIKSHIAYTEENEDYRVDYLADLYKEQKLMSRVKDAIASMDCRITIREEEK